MKSLITDLINRQADHKSQCDEEKLEVTEKKDDLEADVGKHTSKFEAVTARSTVQDSEISAVQLRCSVKGSLPTDTKRADGKLCSIHTHCERTSYLYSPSLFHPRLRQALELRPLECSSWSKVNSNNLAELSPAENEADVAYQKITQERQGVCSTRNRRAPV